MSSISQIGIYSLMAFQSALKETSENLANANTPYYSRRIVNFVPNQFNSGVSACDVRRISDTVVNQYDQMSTSHLSSASAYLLQLKSFEPLFDTMDTSIGKSLTDSLSALEKLNTDVASIQNRTLYMGKLNEIAGRFQNINQQIATTSQSNKQQMTTDVSEVNNILQQIVAVNHKLTEVDNHNNPNLLDQRDQYMQELAKYMNFSSKIDDNGVASLYLSNGQFLVAGSEASTVTTMPDPGNPQNIQIALQNGGNTASIMNYISSGELIGLVNFQKNTLEPTQRALDRLAMGIAQSLNQQNKLGMDFHGNLGSDIFNDVNSANVIANRTIANAKNSGSGSMDVTITDVTRLTTSDYQLSIGPAQTYVLTRLSDHAVMSTGTISSTFPQSISIDGFSVSINRGTFNTGDQYIISPTHGGSNNFVLTSQDPTRLALAWPVMATVENQAPGSTGSIQVTNITDTTNAAFSVLKNLNPPLQIQFLSATSYQIVNASNNQVMEGPITYDPAATSNLFPTPGGYDPGYRVSLSGTIQTGDTFAIGYNTNNADNSNGMAIASLYQKGLFDQGALTWGQGYAALTSDVSIETSRAKSVYDAADVIKQQTAARRDAISGVSIEEETMNLNEYQQYYQASAQILATAKSVFDTIIEMTRR